MTFKKIIGITHLWLGLMSGLVVVVISLTGCIYAFQAEIQDVIQPYRFVESQNKAFLPPSILAKIAQKQLPNKQIHAIVFGLKTNAAKVEFFHYEPTYYYGVYLNPYSGKVLKVINLNAGFFRFILDGHFYLWLPPKIGQPVVASFTLVFIIILISGIVLWWPKNKVATKQRFKFSWKNTTQWKRKNYDLHNILGFYASFIIVILASTGLIWGFQWFANSVYWKLGGEKSMMYQDAVSNKPIAKSMISEKSIALDKVWQIMQEQYPTAQKIEVHPPETDSSSIATNATVDASMYWKNDYRYFDQYSLRELSVNHIYGRLKDAKLADKTIRMNYDVHTGGIFGLAGKILAFFSSLIAASLPITGFLIWWGRRKKELQSKNKVNQKSLLTTQQI